MIENEVNGRTNGTPIAFDLADIATHRRCWNEGLEAGRAGQPSAACPYDTKAEEAAWLAGWAKA
jgi:ribosome modulation factor